MHSSTSNTSAEEIGEFSSPAVMDPKNKNGESIQVSDQKELSNTDQRQADDCEEFRDRVQKIIDGVGETYSSHGEDLPKLPIYDTSYRHVEERCIGLVKEAQSLLKSSLYQDEETARLIQLATESQSIRYPPARKIGLLGDSGAGKSTLVNALLDAPGLALEGASGRAATCVITEYKHAWPDQKTPFMAEIKFYGLDKIRNIIQHEFRAYYNFTLAHIDNENQETQDELSACQETAVEIFKALFANREEFHDEDTIKEFFKIATSAKDRNILNTLIKWVERILVEHGANDGLLCLNADSVEELAGKVAPFTKTCTYVANDEGRLNPSLWPLVEIVRIGLYSRLLKHGLVIADLPGHSDVNRTRMKTTTEYIRLCDAALLVAPIARVETDSQVHKRLGEVHRMFGNKKALVVTKIDETRSLSRPSELEPTPEAAKEYDRLVSASQFKAKEISRLVNLRSTAKGKMKETLTQQISKIQLEKKAFNVLDRQALIIMRNEKSGRNIRRKYKKITLDQQPLPFFAVSSADYNTHINEFAADDGFLLPVDTTGIPALRNYCYRIPAQSKLDALTQYREGTLTELINSLYIWSSQYKVQRRSALKKVVVRPFQEIEAIVVKCVKDIELLVEDCILENSKKSQKDWIDCSTMACNGWVKWHAKTFEAFCRHDGAWETGKQSFCNWNGEMLKPVVKDLEIAWKTFGEAISDCKEKFYSALTALLENIRADLRDIDGVAAEPMVPFLASLTGKKAQLRQQVEKFFDQVKSTSRTTKLDVDMTDQDPDCFLMRAIIPVYARCRKASAEKRHKNLHTVRCTLLEDAVSKGEQFSQINSGIEKSFKEMLEKQQPKLVESVQKIFLKVVQDFNSMFIVEELPSPKRDALRQEIQRFVSDAKAEINGPIEAEFVKATKRSS